MSIPQAPAPAGRFLCGLTSALVLVAATLLPGSAAAQVAGPNVNMVSGTQWPGGDPFLQRQNEPSLDVSTRNPLHILAGANDYRTVDLPFADQLPAEGNAGDAWLGLFKSFDGGRTWQSTLLAGYPQDQSKDGLASPLKGFAAGADPTVRAGTNGLFYYSGIAFNRGKNAAGVLFLALFIDNNNKENGDATLGRDPIKYVRTVVVRSGNAGQFLDKPTLAVDVPRAGAGACTIVTAKGGGATLTQTVPAGRVYVAWSEFVGGDNNIRTKLYVAASADCGTTFGQPVKISEGYPVNQGAALAIDPATGYVYVAWRRFPSTNQTSAILVARSTDGGQKFSSPVEVVSLPAYDATKPAAPTFFDQGTTSGSFRTNAYPALAIDETGRLYLAWSQRGAGAGSDARIVMSTSSNGGTAWTAPVPIDNGLVLDDEGNPFGGLAGCGHQLMPALRFGAGKLMAVYYDLRLDHTIGLFAPVAHPPSSAGLFFTETRLWLGEPPSDTKAFTPFVTDTDHTLRRHTLDVRVAQASPAAFPSFTSARASRYVFGSRPGQTRIEQLQINPPNLPMFVQGTAPFMGDYIEVAGPPPFVPRPDGSWTYNSAPAGDALFHAAWTDNRDVRPPGDGNWTHYTPVGSTGGPSVFDPTQNQPKCVDGQTGMRNQNVYTSAISQGLVVSAPFNAKPLTTLFQRVFVTVVQNTTEYVKSYRLTIASQPPDGKASFLRDPVAGLAYPLTTLDVSIAPRSSVSRPVFITSSAKNASVTVNVAEIAAPAGPPVSGGLTGAVVFNPDVSNPDVSNPDVSNPDVSNPDVSNVEVYTPDVSNPDVSNPDVSNPDVSNPDVSNPDVSNPDVSNPDVSNLNVATPDVSNPDVSNPDVSNPDVSNPDVSNTGLTDANYRITNNGNTAATYRIRLVGNPPVSAKLQLILSKVYATPVALGCTLREQPQNTLVANITHPVFNPDVSNPDVSNPDVSNPDVSNATMSLAPGETGLITLRGTVGKGQAGIDAMKKIISEAAPVIVPAAPRSDAPPNTPPTVVSPLFITTSVLPDGTAGMPYAATVQAIGGKTPYTYAVSAGALPPGLGLSTAGVLSGTPTAGGTYSFTVQVTDSTAPPRTALRALTVRVTGIGPGAWTATGSMSVPRRDHTATVLNDGTVLVIGYMSQTAEIYDPATGLFSPTGPPQYNHEQNPTATLLEDGRVLIAGGTGAYTGAELYNPTTRTFSVTGSFVMPHFAHAAVRLDDGRVLIAGGGYLRFFDPYWYSYSTAAAEIYDPATGLFTLTGSLNVDRVGITGTKLNNGKVLVVGGYTSIPDQPGYANYALTNEIYDPVSGTFSFTASTDPPAGGAWWTTAPLLDDGRVFVLATGDNAHAYLFDSTAGTFFPVGISQVDQQVPTAVKLSDGRILISGGYLGGTETFTLTAAAQIFDPATGVFTRVADMNQAREEHTAVLLHDGTVLVTGGAADEYTDLTSAERYLPATTVPAATTVK
jgi:hypothetical protein